MFPVLDHERFFHVFESCEFLLLVLCNFHYSGKFSPRSFFFPFVIVSRITFMISFSVFIIDV